MLGQLFGSNARVKILKLFLLHPEKKYYIRQLSRDLKLQVNSVRRELENLEKFGLLLSSFGLDENLTVEDSSDSAIKDNIITKKILGIPNVLFGKKNHDNEIKDQLGSNKQERKYYKVNPNFVLLEEIRALIVKAQILYERDFIKKLSQIGKIKLLVLTGVFVNENRSKVDLLIVGRANKPKFLKLIKELEIELSREINFTLMDSAEFKYRRDITDVFLYDILEGKKIVVIDELGIS